MTWSPIFCAATLVVFASRPEMARADDRATKSGAGRAAAHTALDEGAGLPSSPPQLPELGSGRGREAQVPIPAGKKAEAGGKARAEAHGRAAADARAAHLEAATRAADESVAAAAHGAMGEERSAAGQARAAAAHAAAAARKNGGSSGKNP
jgi:hypothetical protein